MQQQTQTCNGAPVRVVNIRGKAYVDVAERVRLAHSQGGFTMQSSEVFELAGRAFCRVTILYRTERYIGTAEVKLNAKPGTADHDAPLECAETSALGRALGFAGIGVLDGGSIASANELERVYANR